MRTNHKWNILNIMRYYTRIGKEFNAEVYVRFVTPAEGSHAITRNPITLPQAMQFIRRHVENGWCKRVGKNLVITDKGVKALEAWEKTRYLKSANVSDETLRRRRLQQD